MGFCHAGDECGANGDPELAGDYLLHPMFELDDAGYPVGGSEGDATAYPNSALLLVVTAIISGGWDGDEGAEG